ncbi:MAG: NifB/NifX family molybdenum-iron cluster-binding protein [Candidatus Lokiarchaeota archaeon]|nr:NifB/NifX family molybdenum-iron cluster-binding protein [Candidatus Lokiarchaeota archaeon]
MSIIAIPSMGNGGLNDEMSPRFGRCASFTFVEVENNEIKAVKTVPNHAADAMGGAGVQATQIIGNNGANAIIVGFLGPNAASGLNALNIQIFQAPNKAITIKEVMNLYIEGKLKTISTSNVASHYGMGGGRGMGGRGMGGRGQGMGRGNQP